ncbi:MAG: glycosyltransferase family 4 protein [Lachnospiraceae bacterium]|nr:glycosyltransferase family 4 protein [Lachnospiraceae bacterium]
MKKFVINGLFMCEKLSGVQRYAVEVLKIVDELIGKNDISMEILVPCETVETWRPVNIRLIEPKTKSDINGIGKHWWLNVILPAYASKNKATIINLCNNGPLFKRCLTSMHDIIYRTDPEFFTFRQRLLPEIYYFFQARNSKHIFTLTQYTADQLKKYYGVKDYRVTVTGVGWEHILKVGEDKSVLDRYGLSEGGYYISVGNVTPHKNFLWVIEEAINNPAERFVVIGSNVHGISRGRRIEIPENVQFVGRASDEAVKSLMLNAKALLFPSFCEGFGIPPLEMLGLGGNAIVADSSCLPEVFRGSVLYVDPLKTDYRFTDFSFEGLEAEKERVLKKYTWDVVAKRWMNLLNEV